MLTDSEITTLYGEAATGTHYQAQALNNPTGFSATGLPSGLSINPTTGAITGQTMSVGDHNITITASNLSGTSPSKNLILTVAPDKPLFENELVRPATLSSLKLWLDASDGASITHSSNAVSQWNDKSGNNNHATQSSADHKPTYSDSGMSGKAGLDFDNDKLSIPEINMDGKSLFAAIQPDTSKDQQILSDSSFNVQLRLSANNTLRYASSSPLYSGNPSSTGTIANNQISIVSFSLGNTLGFSINGTFQDSGVNKGSSVIRIFDQIGTRQGSSNRFDGKMGEILIISSVSSTEREKVEGYLAHKMGYSRKFAQQSSIQAHFVKTKDCRIIYRYKFANITADLIDLGGASTALSAHYGTFDGGTDIISWQGESNHSGVVSLGQSTMPWLE